MMRSAWFELVLLLFLMTFMYSLYLVGIIPLVCPMYSLGDSWQFVWYMTLRKHLLCEGFTYISFPIVLLVTKDMLHLYS
jgi:hypothetical protein